MVNNNAQNLIKQVLSSADTVGLLQAKDVGGTTRYIADFSAYPSSVEDSFTLTAANAGISVGSGSTAPTASDYQLVSTITSGLTGNVTSSNNVDANGNASITFTVALTNTSSSNISISEIGYKQEISASDELNGTTATDRVFLLDRSVFDTITIAPSSQVTIDYTLKAVITNNGGAVGTKSITANGTYNALNDNLDGYSTVTVNVQALLGTKSITSNGTYNASGDSLEGYSSVTVNVTPNVGTKNISTNGTYNASGDSLDGYSSVTVAVSPNVGTKSITSNGTYNSSSDSLDGYSQVVVNVSGGGGVFVKATPNMTSDTTPSGEVIYSSCYSGTYPAWKAFNGYDDNGSETWLSSYSDNVGSWIGYHFTEAVCIKKAAVSVRNNPSYPHAVKRFKLQGSNDGNTWIDIQECATTSATALQRDEYIIENDDSYTYYRLYTLEVWDLQDVDQNAAYNQVELYYVQSGIFGTKVIYDDGTYDAQDDNFYGYSEVTICTQNISSFSCTETIQTYTVPKSGHYKLEVWGAQGGSSGSRHGGYGGYSTGEIDLAEGDILYIGVGGMGGNNNNRGAGYNGGGDANYGGNRADGGGATHIAKVTGTLDSLSSNINDILIVAGGGGGAASYSGNDQGDGGSGGGYIGGHGLYNDSTTGDSNSHTGSGGTQLAGGETDDYTTQSTGAFGQGASRDDGDLWGGSGGGGGFYGGGASTNNAGAGGGSGYISSELSNACMYGYSVSESSATATRTVSVNVYSETANKETAKVGNGYCRITLMRESYYELATPLMTSNMTPSGVVSASSYFDNLIYYQPWFAFSSYRSGDQQTWTSASGSTTGEWISYQFPEAVAITKLVTVNRNEEDLGLANYDNGAIETFKFQGSDNGSSWTDIDTCTITSDAGHHEETFYFNNTTEYLYYRIYVISAYGDNFVGLSQVKMYKGADAHCKLITSNGYYEAKKEGFANYTSVLVNIASPQINPFPQGTSTLTPYNSNGITINSSSIDTNGTLEVDFDEAQAGYEGMVIELNTTPGHIYKVEFDYQNISAQYFSGYVLGWLLENSARTNYDDWEKWSNNIERDTILHHYENVIIATGNKIYVNFNLCGYSDGTTNNAQITNFKVYENTVNASPYLITKGATYYTFELTNESGGAYANFVTKGIQVNPHAGAWGMQINVTDLNDIVFIISAVTNAQYAYIGVGDILGYSTSGANLDVKAGLSTGTEKIYRLDVSDLTGNKYLQFTGGVNALATIESIMVG